jgi:hypothetical protein
LPPSAAPASILKIAEPEPEAVEDSTSANNSPSQSGDRKTIKIDAQ